MDRAALEQQLAHLTTFTDPTPDLEQYVTNPELASRLIHLATLHDDLTHTVIDLGTGTGILAIGAALANPATVIGIDRDPTTIQTAQTNERTVTPPTQITWMIGDVTHLPLHPPEPVTVLSNPPFGAQNGQTHADRAFLNCAADIAAVSYTIHNANSLDFIEAFAADNDGTVTHAYSTEIDIPHQFTWHTPDTQAIDVELVRIEWRT